MPSVTEHGAIQAANVLASPRAVEMGIYVVRALVRIKQASVLHADLAKRLAELEVRTEGIMTPPDPPTRPIRFIKLEDSGKKTSAKNKGCVPFVSFPA